MNKKTKKIPGKAGLRFYKNVGLGFKTPKEAIEGRYQTCKKLISYEHHTIAPLQAQHMNMKNGLSSMRGAYSLTVMTDTVVCPAIVEIVVAHEIKDTDTRLGMVLALKRLSDC